MSVIIRQIAGGAVAAGFCELQKIFSLLLFFLELLLLFYYISV